MKFRIQRQFLATLSIGISCAAAAQEPPNSTISLASLQQCAQAGVAECQFEYAKRLENGSGVGVDHAAALAWYEKAYAGGHMAAGDGLLRLIRQAPKAKDIQPTQGLSGSGNSTTATNEPRQQETRPPTPLPESRSPTRPSSIAAQTETDTSVIPRVNQLPPLTNIPAGYDDCWRLDTETVESGAVRERTAAVDSRSYDIYLPTGTFRWIEAPHKEPSVGSQIYCLQSPKAAEGAMIVNGSAIPLRKHRNGLMFNSWKQGSSPYTAIQVSAGDDRAAILTLANKEGQRVVSIHSGRVTKVR